MNAEILVRALAIASVPSFALFVYWIFLFLYGVVKSINEGSVADLLHVGFAEAQLVGGIIGWTSIALLVWRNLCHEYEAGPRLLVGLVIGAASSISFLYGSINLAAVLLTIIPIVFAVSLVLVALGKGSQIENCKS